MSLDLDDKTTGLLRRRAEPLAPIEETGFAEAFDRFAEAKVVLLGEATHGTAEFYRARTAITRRLVERHGFSIVAFEADWPDVAELDRFARNWGVWGRETPFVNFPRWMWRNAEVSALVRALRTWNLARPVEARVELRGLDVYSLTQSQAQVVQYLAGVDPAAAAAAARRYACLRPFLDSPQQYGYAAFLGRTDCEDAVVAQLVDLLGRRAAYARDHDRDYFDAEQNARAVVSAEAYYRAMYRGSVESWNLRDTHMFRTLVRLLAARGPTAKAVVWAHNSHVGDARATAMGAAGEHNIGQLCREAMGSACVSIGFFTDRGQVMAADNWGERGRVMDVRPARRDSWERVLLETAPSRSLTVWRDDPDLAAALDGERLERAIGVIYRPETERPSHYFEARLSRQFDAAVWFERTTPVTALAGTPAQGAPDIYPFGV